MASTSDIKHSIRSISETGQITRAMKLISTSKMRRAISRFESNSIYFRSVQSSIKDILVHSRGTDISHSYITESNGGKAAFIVVAADKGLCGGYNHNVLNLALEHINKCVEHYILTIGQEARAFFERKKYMIDAQFLHMSQNPSLRNARSIASDIFRLFEEGVMNEVYVVYTHFISVMRQQPKVLKLLPVSMKDLVEIETEIKYSAELKYHPSPKEVFDVLVPQYLIGIIYGCLVQSYASEQCARMTAMENATKNADEMIERLTMDYNRARQQAITKEITEIMGALEALS
jgi:F-type H+-transporting ATPase subunit gamma